MLILGDKIPIGTSSFMSFVMLALETEFRQAGLEVASVVVGQGQIDLRLAHAGRTANLVLEAHQAFSGKKKPRYVGLAVAGILEGSAEKKIVTFNRDLGKPTEDDDFKGEKFRAFCADIVSSIKYEPAT